MKNDRQKKIIELVENRCIETQEQLLDQLRQCGFHSTQATVSRDIKELQIVKSLDGMGGYRYCLPHRVEGEKFGARFRVIFRTSTTPRISSSSRPCPVSAQLRARTSTR